MSPSFRRRFRRHKGQVIVALTNEEREALGEFLQQLRRMLVDDSDPSLRRLKPPAQPDDPASELNYREMIGDDLLRSRLDAISTVESGLQGATLDDDEAAAWMQSLNCIRLILGERFEVEGINPDNADTDSPMSDIYHWLAWLLEQLVEAAMPGLDN